MTQHSHRRRRLSNLATTGGSLISIEEDHGLCRPGRHLARRAKTSLQTSYKPIFVNIPNTQPTICFSDTIREVCIDNNNNINSIGNKSDTHNLKLRRRVAGEFIMYAYGITLLLIVSNIRMCVCYRYDKI